MSEAPEPGAPPTTTPSERTRFDPAQLGPFGRALTLAPPQADHEERPVTEMVCGDGLGSLVHTLADQLDVEPTIAASAWLDHLTTILVPGVLTAWTLEGLGLDVSPANLALHLEGPLPRRCRVLDPTRTASGDPDRDMALQSLLGGTLTPLFDRLGDLTGLPASIPWGMVGNLVAYCFDRLAEQAPDQAEGLARDRARLLDADRAAWAAIDNPIQDAVTYVTFEDPDLPDRFQVRRVCCLKRQIPGKRSCASCPRVSTEKRATLLEARRGSG